MVGDTFLFIYFKILGGTKIINKIFNFREKQRYPNKQMRVWSVGVLTSFGSPLKKDLDDAIL